MIYQFGLEQFGSVLKNLKFGFVWFFIFFSTVLIITIQLF